jgi:hypothetical protein
VGENPLTTSALSLQLTEAKVALAAPAAGAALVLGSGFADQRGGGIFVGQDAHVVRLRLDGEVAALENHPQNKQAPGRVQRVLPVGADSAWVLADNGVYVARAGWLYELRVGLTIAADDVVAIAVASDQQAFIALKKGLYRLDAGELSELTASGKALAGVGSVAVAPAPDGSTAVWFTQGQRLRYAKQLTRTRYEIADAGLPESALNHELIALASVTAAPGSLGELWVLTPNALLKHTPEHGFTTFELPATGEALLSAGRFVWLQAGGQLYRYTADGAATWGQFAMAKTPQLLAADATGSAWVRTSSGSQLLADRALPRVLGMFEGGRVYATDVQLSARLAVADDPLSVTFVLDDGEKVERTLEQALSPESDVGSLDFSLGGFDAAGREQTYSFAGLSAGLHTLSVRATHKDGKTERRLHFDMHRADTLELSWARDVEPIYSARCEKCHSPGPGHPGHLLDSYELWSKEKTQIVAAVVELRMPADGPLDPTQIQTIQRWAAAGGAP